MQTHTPTVVQVGMVGTPPPQKKVFVTLRYFEKFLPLIDSVLRHLQDDVKIMGYICKWRCWGTVTSSNMADLMSQNSESKTLLTQLLLLLLTQFRLRVSPVPSSS